MLGCSCLLQTYNYQTQKQTTDIFIKTNAKRPLKRACLTKKNLKAFKKIEEQQRKFAKKKFIKQLTIITIINKDFSTKLQQNNIVYTAFNTRALDNIKNIKELLDRL
jgi:hypothetical protein